MSKRDIMKYEAQQMIKHWFIVNAYGLLSLIVMIIIFLFSSQSGKESSNMSNSVKQIFLSIFGLKQVVTVFNIRKIAHFTLYALLGTTIFTHIRCKYRFTRRRLYYLLSLLCVFVYAVSDEIHQYFIPGRGCSGMDVLIDCFGCIIALTINYLIISHLERVQNKRLSQVDLD